MYTLSYELWEQLGFPDIDDYVAESTVNGDFILNIDPTDNSGNGIPDFLDQLAGYPDIILKPSQGVVFG